MGIAERKEREKQEMKELILQSATKIFVEEGFYKTSIRKIADTIEYSPATIYLYFKDKNEIFYAIQKEAFLKFFSYFQQVGPMEGQDPINRLKELGRMYIKFAIENPEYYDLMFIMRAPMEAEDTHHKWDEGHRSHGVLEEIVAQCIQAGHFKEHDPFYTAHAIWSFVHGLASLYVRDRMKMFEGKNNEEIMFDTLEVYNDWLDKL